jgi:hypothetical protein
MNQAMNIATNKKIPGDEQNPKDPTTQSTNSKNPNQQKTKLDSKNRGDEQQNPTFKPI